MLHPQLQDWKREFESIKHEAQDLVAGLTQTQFTWHPEPGRWSVAECLDHLNVIGYQLLPKMDEAIQAARTRGLQGSGPYELGWIGRWFRDSQEPPVRRKFRTVKSYAPKPVRTQDEVVPPFLNLQDEIIGRLEQADGLDLARIRLSSPAMKLLRMNLAAWFAGTASHERRHLWQAQQVKESPGFPRG
jgi:hypothetical protein